RASEEVLATSSVRHQLRGTGDQRSERTAEALREAERHGVETASDARRLDSARDRGVDEARTVQMHGEVVLAARRDDRVDLVERPEAAAGAVMGVLHRDDAG